jgi:hypothetical protein
VTVPGNCLRAVVSKTAADGRAAIVNMASTMSKLAIEGQFAYGRSKGAVVTRSCLVGSLFVQQGVIFCEWSWLSDWRRADQFAVESSVNWRFMVHVLHHVYHDP